MPGLVVNLVTETGGINNSQRDTGALLVQFKLCFMETMIRSSHPMTIPL